MGGSCFRGPCNGFLCSSDVHSQESSDLQHGSDSEQQLVVLEVLNYPCKPSAAEKHVSIFHITKLKSSWLSVLIFVFLSTVVYLRFVHRPSLCGSWQATRTFFY